MLNVTKGFEYEVQSAKIELVYDKLLRILVLPQPFLGSKTCDLAKIGKEGSPRFIT